MVSSLSISYVLASLFFSLINSSQIQRLDLQGDILTTRRNSPAAQNRFLYHPDHLVRMPGPGTSFYELFMSFMYEPVFTDVPECLWRDVFAPIRPDSLVDESIGAFVSRRMGSAPADNIVSAILHGVYAGDVYQLSARSIIPTQWNYEKLGRTVVWTTAAHRLFKQALVSPGDLKVMKELTENVAQLRRSGSPALTQSLPAYTSSVFTFRKGIGHLSDRLVEVLSAKSNVKIYKDAPIQTVVLKEENTSKVDFIAIPPSLLLRHTDLIFRNTSV